MKPSVSRRIFRRLINLNLKYILIKLGLSREKFQPDIRQSTVLSDFFSPVQAAEILAKPRFTEGTAEFRNCKIKYSDNLSFVSMINEIFVNSNYHYPATRRPFIIDCGANIGVSVLYFKKTYPDSTILAIEADPEIYRILVENISTNALEQITALNRAVWIDESTLNFVADRSWGGHLEPGSHSSTSLAVQGIDIASLITSDVDFLKMDLEGAEGTIILHAKETIAKYVKNFFFEYHSLSDRGQQLGEILSYFEKNGFRYHIKEANPKTSPFTEKRLSSRMDCQLDIFLYRYAI